mmetsp:Transcript_6709/g.19234  ORF Transcript_6709/g.19234 Transcript_6709/m.19234 type:complete len:112 (-) Transcript_6709:985-1320(-)
MRASPSPSRPSHHLLHPSLAVKVIEKSAADAFGDLRPVQLTGSFDKTPQQMLREAARLRAEQKTASIEAELGRPVSVSELADLVGEGTNVDFVTNMVFGHCPDHGGHFLDY